MQIELSGDNTGGVVSIHENIGNILMQSFMDPVDLAVTL